VIVALQSDGRKQAVHPYQWILLLHIEFRNIPGQVMFNGQRYGDLSANAKAELQEVRPSDVHGIRCCPSCQGEADRGLHTSAQPKYGEKLKKLREVMAPVAGATETGLIIHEDKCYGCGNCVVACPVNVANDPKGSAIGLGPKSDKVILIVEDGVVKCLNPKECRRFGPNRILCNLCTATCPSKAIEFV
jgi:4Fe-4S ferredoxin